MSTQKISLNDRFDLEKSPVLLNGTQALVRLMLMPEGTRSRSRAQHGRSGDGIPGIAAGCRGHADDPGSQISCGAGRHVSKRA